jgi:putative addiction module component (TIGR02574 family)
MPGVPVAGLVILVVGLKIRLPVTRIFRYIRAMSIDQIAAEALRLPPKERAMLAESLWESLMDPFKIPAWTDDAEAVGLAAERDRQLETGEVRPISHEEMMARLRQ